ncbi:hypothetical protein D9M70_446500 [compost metagenome]
MPRLHGLLQAHWWFLLVRHEVGYLEAALLAMAVGVERGEQRRALLYTHPHMQAAALGAVLLPAQELRVAEPLLRLGDGPAADAAQDQLVPELV